MPHGRQFSPIYCRLKAFIFEMTPRQHSQHKSIFMSHTILQLRALPKYICLLRSVEAEIFGKFIPTSVAAKTYRILRLYPIVRLLSFLMRVFHLRAGDPKSVTGGWLTARRFFSGFSIDVVLAQLETLSWHTPARSIL